MKDEYSTKDYFVYKGVAYGVGTKVRLKQHVFHEPYADIVKNDIYEFYHGTQGGLHLFQWADTVQRPKHITSLCRQIYNCDADIAEIVEPVEVQLVSWQRKAVQDMFSGKAVADVFGGVLIYVVVMCIGAIFKARFGIWIFSTVVFVWWLLNQYRT